MSSKIRTNAEEAYHHIRREQDVTTNHNAHSKSGSSLEGFTGFEAIKHFKNDLTQYEKKEILKYERVYYAGRNSRKHPMVSPTEMETSQKRANYKTSGHDSPEELVPLFDDHENFYHVIKHDHIAYRFEILSILGKGSFGQVVLAHDHMTGAQVALKIIRTESRFTRQAKEEIKILETLRKMRNSQQNDVNSNDFPIVQLFEHFTFRKHICMTFELLSINLYDLLKLNKFVGLPRDRVRRISFQVLKALYYVEKAGIIHCDLKPENVLLIWPPEKENQQQHNSVSVSGSRKSPLRDNLSRDDRDCIKLIDFGSSCFKKGPTYPYIQSRFYRAPEVILRLGYSQPIDMWSFGCLVAELINGLPLFPGEDEADQLSCIMEILGLPPNEMIEKSPHKDRYFVEYQSENPHDLEVLKFVDRITMGSVRGVSYLPKYCSIIYPEDGGSPQLKPRVVKRSGHVRGVPGSMPLLTAILQPRHRRLKGKDSQSMANLLGDSGLTKLSEDESAVQKDNELLLSLMMSCLTWSPQERIKPYNAIQHMWLRNSSKRTCTPSDQRIRSMEVSRLVPNKISEIYEREKKNSPKRTSPSGEQPTAHPRRRKRMTNISTFSDKPIKNNGTDNSYSSTDRSAHLPTAMNGHKALHKISSPGKLGSSQLSVNTVAISPTKLTDGVRRNDLIQNISTGGPSTSVTAERDRINKIIQSQAESTVNHPATQNNKRVTLIYSRDDDRANANKTITINKMNDAQAPVGESLLRPSLLFAVEGNTRRTTHVGQTANRSDEIKRKSISINNRTNSFKGPESFEQFYANSLMNNPAETSEKSERKTNAPLSKYSGSMPYLNSLNSDRTVQHKSLNEVIIGHEENDDKWVRKLSPENKSNGFEESSHPNGHSNGTSFGNSKNTANHVIITKASTSHDSTPTQSSKLIHLIRPTNNGSQASNSHQLKSNEPRLIRVGNLKHKPSTFIADETDSQEGIYSHSRSNQSHRSEMSFENNTWTPVRQSPHRNLERTAPEVAPKPTRDHLLRLNRDTLSSSTTNLWGPQPFYHPVLNQPNNVVFRRITAPPYRRGATIEIQPYSSYSEY